MLSAVVQEVAEATVLFRPTVGPWLWPLHEPETCTVTILHPETNIANEVYESREVALLFFLYVVK